ncbi:MAG: PKD domain-containing protein [bacterium]
MNHREGLFALKVNLLVFFFVLMLSSLATASLVPPEVNVMPDGDTDTSAYTWVGNALTIWGNVVWGSSTSGTYAWDINNDGTADYTGTVTNAKDIACTHTYATSGLYEAKLTVTDGNGESDSAVVRIRVLPSETKEAKINLAIEKGLKWLYLKQGSNGSIYDLNSYSSSGAETAAAVLAFENKGHKPCTQDQDLDGDVDAADRAIWEKDRIYAKTVHAGLDYIISTLTAVGVGAPYDNNGNGVWIADNYYPSSGYRGPYKIGMYMMALVGAGSVASGAPNLVATTGPSGVIGKTYRTIVEDMVDYCDYSQYHSTYGGWRYGPGYGPDNSACQWPAIGMEAAEFGWGVPIRQAIKDLNQNWTNYSQNASNGRFGYTSESAQGTGGYGACTGSGICQLSFQGKVKDDPRIILAGNFLKNNPGLYNQGFSDDRAFLYYMYAVAKGARIAKIDTNGDGKGDTYSEIQFLGSAPGWDWYDAYSTWLITYQNPGGFWDDSFDHTYRVLETSWAVEILTKNVFTLRPIAKLTATPNPTPANSAITFDLSGSFHQDSSKNLVDWWIDVDNNGTFDLSGHFPVTTASFAAGYPDTGSNYAVTARLRVSDNSTPVEFGEDALTINITTGNVPPVADPGGPYNGVIGQPITFDGSNSYDANEGAPLNDSIVSWEWDLDGDGQYDDASGEIVTKTWNTPYSGNIGLKVKDSFGLSSTAVAYTKVVVVDLWPENYTIVSTRRINRYVYEYEYKFDMRNRGTGDAFNVQCSIDQKPPQMTVVDGQVSFGNVTAGAVVTSVDSFKYQHDRRYPMADIQIRWKLEYDDAAGSHIVFLDFPLR